MNRSTFWNRLSKAAESRQAKVLSKLAGAATVLSVVLGLLCVVFPAWLIVLIVIGGLVAAMIGGIGGCYDSFGEYPILARYDGRTLSPCGGGTIASFYDGSDCIRIDPYDDCYRAEPCIGLAFDRYGYASPLPKIAPCSDVLDRHGVMLPGYAGLGCVQIYPSEGCYRPTEC